MVAKNFSPETVSGPIREAEVTELSFLLPAWQVGALEQAAHAEGITVAQLLRRAVNRAIAQSAVEPDYLCG